MPESYDYISNPKTSEEKLLKRIRDRFERGVEEWSDIRAEGDKDMLYIAGDPWEGKEKAARKDEGRPAMVFDELGQYVNQLINDVRMNPHSVKVTARGGNPFGPDSKDKQAAVRADIIRNVEYTSNGKSAYLTGFENAAQRSYGYWRITRKYTDDKSFEQELCIKRLPYPNNVIFDPDYKEADASDIKWAFVVEQMPRDEYTRKYPKAEVVDFSTELMSLVPKWVKEREIQVAEYWEVQETPGELVMVENATGERIVVTGDEFSAGLKAARESGVEPPRELKRRKTTTRQITQYMTNGVEILEELEWDGYWIPLIGCFGKEMYVDRGSGPERILTSLVRAARDPFMFYCYLRSCEAEESAMTPKTPFIGAKGQFDGMTDDWGKVSKSPLAYLEYNIVTDQSGGTAVGPPMRQPFQPNFQSYEVACEAARRAIQAAMGISPLPVAAQRRNEKSGIALDKIQQAEQKGSYHFIDNLLLSIEHSGRVMNDLIDKTYDTARDVPVRKPDGTSAVQRLNDKTNPDAVDITGDPHDVTISTGPSFDSQRDEAADYADTIAKIPGVFEKVGDLLTRLRNLGPIGDEIAGRLTPPALLGKDGKPLPPEAAAMVAQLQQAHQALNAYAQKLEKELQDAKQKEQAKVIDNQFKVQLAKMDNETKIAIAEIGAKVQDAMFRIETQLKAWQDMHGAAADHAEAETQRAHEKDMQAATQSHEAQQAQQAQEAAAQQSQQDQTSVPDGQ